jgi:hypothetical protein
MTTIEHFVIPGKRSATRNPLCFLDSRFRGNDGKLILCHFARGSFNKHIIGAWQNHVHCKGREGSDKPAKATCVGHCRAGKIQANFTAGNIIKERVVSSNRYPNR